MPSSVCLWNVLSPKLAIVHCFYSFNPIWQFSVKSACVSCFLVFHPVGEYISLDLFYFVSLTSSCSLIPKNVKLNKFHCFVKLIPFQPCVRLHYYCYSFMQVIQVILPNEQVSDYNHTHMYTCVQKSAGGRSYYNSEPHARIHPWPNEVKLGWLCCPCDPKLCGNPSGKQAHKQLIRECLSSHLSSLCCGLILGF